MPRSNIDLANRIVLAEKRQIQRQRLGWVPVAFLALFAIFSAQYGLRAVQEIERRDTEIQKLELELAERTRELKDREVELSGRAQELEDREAEVAFTEFRNHELERMVEELTMTISELKNTVLASAVGELRQVPVYQGDNPSLAVGDEIIAVDCGEMVDATTVSAEAPTGFSFARLERIGSVAGGRCGHTFYAATFIPDTF